jgi:hypothetical protein
MISTGRDAGRTARQATLLVANQYLPTNLSSPAKIACISPEICYHYFRYKITAKHKEKRDEATIHPFFNFIHRFNNGYPVINQRAGN